MAETRSENLGKFHLRANLPRYFRYGAIGLLVITLIAIGISFYWGSRDPQFRMQGFPTSLSKDVVASINGYERTEFDGGVRKYYLKADRATTFADNHQELENAFIEVFEESGEKSDKITADKAIYVPEENKNFTAYLAGSVNAETRDELKVKTEQVTYKKAGDTATAEEAVEFQRDNINGKSFGANIKIAEKKIELLRDVEIRQYETTEMAGEPAALINAGFASYDQLNEKIELQNGTTVHSISKSPARVTDLKAGRATIQLVAADENKREIKTAELFEQVAIDSTESGSSPTNINSGYALYDKPADRFDLRDNVHIVTTADANPTTITSSRAIYEQTKGLVDLDGPAEITQGNNFSKGDKIHAQLFPSKKLKNARVLGNGYIRQIEIDRTVEISGSELNATFADGQALTDANALNNASAILTPTKPDGYSKVTMTAPRSIGLRFKTGGILEQMLTDGRTTIQLDVPNNEPDAANKRVTADTVKTFFSGDGKNIQRAEAVGNAELFVEPLKASAENYKTTINAPRFDCEFYPSGNNAKNCDGGKGTKTVRVPTVPDETHGTQTLTADKLNAAFGEKSRDIEKMDAVGNAKFAELDRSGLSDQMSFTSADGVVRLRGGEPTVWDSRARAKAQEIDWDTKNQKSYLRNGASTTYYSQKQTGGATPFSDSNKPVFVTAANAEIDHKNETAVYTGNARGWQENSYVRANRLFIQQKQGQFDADGNVQSLLYDVKRKENGKESIVPVSASSQSMTYFRDTRLIRYVTSVDIRQATDRITGEKADVYLNDKNEILRSEIEKNVVITQPKRKANADYASYTAADEVVVLKGNPARVEDADSGVSQAAQMTMYMRDNRVSIEGRSTQNTAGRTRSVYKVKEN
ncbi:MAG TPA: LPS export ABC transporter periplasmic protein LptC [Pyrinomonadaceae bacterium]|nr:LPS export ABC transporter periplasmic protein LptC [Pyrinomonadaceae bacterium]